MFAAPTINSVVNIHCSVAMWLYMLGADIHAENDAAFRLSCENGHKDIAMWLHGLGADIHAKNDLAFQLCCTFGKKDIAIWLYELGGIPKNIVDKYYGKNCSSLNNL